MASYPYAILSRYVQRQVRQLSRQLRGIEQAKDPEFIHRARVACRRLRASLKCLRDILPRRLTVGWKLRRRRRELRDFARQLGEARDVDVQIHRFQELGATGLAGEQRLAVEQVLDWLRDFRRNLQPAVKRGVGKFRKKKVLERLEDWAQFLEKASAGVNETTEVLAAATEFLRAYVQSVIEGAKNLTGDAAPEAIHQLRIALKRLRYSLELWEGASPNLFAPAIQQCRQWQELLGEVCDVFVSMNFLKQYQAQEFTKGRNQRPSFSGGDTAPDLDYCLQLCRQRAAVLLDQIRSFVQKEEDEHFWQRFYDSLTVEALERGSLEKA
jgi:CHAD domain-containing protein